MDAGKFITNFEALFDEVEPNTITLDTVFRDLDEWSSLMALSIIAMVDEEYDYKLTADNFKESIRVGDLFSKISNA
jgi:acyl carrier protein